MRIAIACLVVALGCSDKHEQKAPPVTKQPDKPAARDTACVAKTKELEPWLAALDLESASYEIDFGFMLQPIDRAPFPVEQHIDSVSITKKTIGAYDIGEHNHAGSDLGKQQRALEAKLAEMKGKAAGADEIDP